MHSIARVRLSPSLGVRTCRFSTIGDTILSFKDVSFEYRPNQLLLDKVNFSIKEGSKVTIMGQNGSGKSTIMKLMNGFLQPSQGSIHIKNTFALSRALQVVPIEDRNKTVKEFFSARLHGNTSGIDGRIVKALQAVELEGISTSRVMSSFSGGQQARLLLASSLILEPDILLLDEPTNNLDIKGIEMLTNFIQTTPKTCIVISHDEDFLNQFTDSVLYLDTFQKKIEYYDGNYLNVKREITKRIEKENMENTRLQKEIEQKKQQANAFANKGGAVRKVAKKLKAAAEELESSKIMNVRKEDRVLIPFKIPFQKNATTIGASSFKIYKISLPRVNLFIDFGAAPLYINKGQKVRIKGPNGIGKTTLLESIVHGHADGIEINHRAVIGYYRQDFHNLNHNATVYESLLEAAKFNQNKEGHIRKTAAGFFLQKEMMNQVVHTLSEGQKGLLSMACLVLQEPGILIMDEPTNHINFRHLPVIAKALNEYEGTMLLVSHDQDFVNKVHIDSEIDLANLQSL